MSEDEPERWGLSEEGVACLGKELYEHWKRYRMCFTTGTRNTRERSYEHLRGQLTMDQRRNFAHIEERVTAGEVNGSVVILDESADEKAGSKSAGAGRQHNGRLGKIGLCQVTTCLSYANTEMGLWTLLDGELFLPEAWFDAVHAELRKKVSIPVER